MILSVSHSVVSNPVTTWTVARQAPLSVGSSRQEQWRGLPCPPPGDLPHPGTESKSHVSCTDRQVLYHQHHGGSPRIYGIRSELKQARICHILQMKMFNQNIMCILLSFAACYHKRGNCNAIFSMKLSRIIQLL